MIPIEIKLVNMRNNTFTLTKDSCLQLQLDNVKHETVSQYSRKNLNEVVDDISIDSSLNLNSSERFENFQYQPAKFKYDSGAFSKTKSDIGSRPKKKKIRKLDIKSTLMHLKFHNSKKYARQINLKNCPKELTKTLESYLPFDLNQYEEKKVYCNFKSVKSILPQDIDTNLRSKARFQDFIFPMDRKAFLNVEQVWTPIYDNLIQLKRIYKIENIFSKKKYRLHLEEKNLGFVSANSLDQIDQLSSQINWLDDLDNAKAKMFKDKINIFYNDLITIDKRHKSRIESDNSDLFRLSYKTKSTSRKSIVPGMAFDNINNNRANNPKKSDWSKNSSALMKMWLKTKPYIKTHTQYDAETKIIETNYIDMNYKLCEVINQKPYLNDLGAAKCFKTKDIFKSYIEYFGKKQSSYDWKLKFIHKPDIIYDVDTKLFDINGHLIEGTVVVFQRIYKDNNKYYISNTTLLVD